MKPKRKAAAHPPARRSAVSEALGDRRALARAVVIGFADSGAIRVRFPADALGDRECDLLQTSGGAPLRLENGDPVLVFLGNDAGQRDVVIGRVGPAARADEKPEELVFEAASNLVLRCGESSVDLRKDGRVVVKGKDVVSHAARLNRIRGGAVSIN